MAAKKIKWGKNLGRKNEVGMKVDAGKCTWQFKKTKGTIKGKSIISDGKNQQALTKEKKKIVGIYRKKERMWEECLAKC
jgi:hypothetical protein